MIGSVQMIKLYHGTNLSSAFDIWLHGVDLNKSLPNLDFGKGFYTTGNKGKAITRALKKTSDYNRIHGCTEEAYLVELIVDDNLFYNMNYKKFNFRTDEWYEFVVNNRLDTFFLNKNNIFNHNKDNKYDIVFGEIADGEISNLINDVKQNRIALSDLNYSLILPRSGMSYDNQYSFHTEKSLSCIKGVSCAIIKSYNKRKKVE